MNITDYIRYVATSKDKHVNKLIYDLYNEFNVNESLFKYEINFLLNKVYNKIIIDEKPEILRNNFFENTIMNKYKKCIISDVDISECVVCYLNPMYNSIDSGLLMSASLGKLYMSYYFSINPYTLKIELSDKTEGKNLSCNMYENKKINFVNMNNNLLLSLLIHYRQFKSE